MKKLLNITMAFLFFCSILSIKVPIVHASGTLIYREDANHIGYLRNSYMVTTGSVNTWRYTTLGWKVSINNGVRNYTTIVKKTGSTFSAVNLGDNQTQIKLNIPLNAQAFVDSLSPTLVWNRSIMDNFCLEYSGAADRQAITEFLAKGGDINIDTIMSTIPPNQSTPQGDIRDYAKWSDSNKYTNSFVYDTYTGISTAEPWAYPEDLQSYYQQTISFNAQPMAPIGAGAYARYAEVDDSGKIVQFIISPDKSQVKQFPVGTTVNVTYSSDDPAVSTYQYLGCKIGYNQAGYDETKNLGTAVNVGSLSAASQATMTLSQSNYLGIVTFFYKKPVTLNPYVIGEVTNDPTSKEFDGNDVTVKVTVKGTVQNLPSNKIKEWVLTANKEGDKYEQSVTIPGNNTTVSKDFTFTIPKSVMANLDSYIQKFQGQATVYDVSGNSFTHVPAPIVVTTEIYKATVPPAPIPEDHDPSLLPPQVDMIVPDSTNPQKPTVFYDPAPTLKFDYGSPEGFDAQNYVLDITDAQTGRNIYRIMDHNDPGNYKFIPLNQTGKIVRGKFLSCFYLVKVDGLQKGKVYAASVRAYDGHNWSGTTDDYYFEIAGQPKAAFDVTPTELYEGDTATLTNKSTHSDNRPMTATWVITDPNGNSTTATSWDTQAINLIEGTYHVDLTVKDDLGTEDSTSGSFVVLNPNPKAVLKIQGTFKENRKLTIDSLGSFTPSRFPFVDAKTKFSIVPVNDASLTTQIRPSAVINGQNVADVLIKKAGAYQVTLYIENARGKSDTSTETIYIEPDVAPVADFIITPKTFRDKNDSLWATITIKNNESISLDQDIIQQKIWHIKYNLNNNKDASGLPDFSDDHELIFRESDLPVGTDVPFMLDGNTYLIRRTDENLIIKTKQVGYYLADLEAIEEFGQPTIDAYTNPSDRRRDDTFTKKPQPNKTCVVDNQKPVVSWSIS